MTSQHASLFSVSGRVACVTGASSGLGRYVATTLAEAGAKVVGVARREQALTEWQNTMGGASGYVCHDLMDSTGLARLAEKVSSIFGAPDIVIHAAGVNHRQEADAVTAKGWDETIWINLSVPFFFKSAFCPCNERKTMGADCEFCFASDNTCFPWGYCLWGVKRGYWSIDPCDGRVMVE